MNEPTDRNRESKTTCHVCGGEATRKNTGLCKACELGIDHALAQLANGFETVMIPVQVN